MDNTPSQVSNLRYGGSRSTQANLQVALFRLALRTGAT